MNAAVSVTSDSTLTVDGGWTADAGVPTSSERIIVLPYPTQVQAAPAAGRILVKPQDPLLAAE